MFADSNTVLADSNAVEFNSIQNECIGSMHSCTFEFLFRAISQSLSKNLNVEGRLVTNVFKSIRLMTLSMTPVIAIHFN